MFLILYETIILYTYIYVYIFRNISSNRDPFVLTSAVKKSYEMVVLAVSQKWPVLLYGPAGAGKTALINKLAHDSGNQGTLLCHRFVFCFPVLFCFSFFVFPHIKTQYRLRGTERPDLLQEAEK